MGVGRPWWLASASPCCRFVSACLPGWPASGSSKNPRQRMHQHLECLPSGRRPGLTSRSSQTQRQVDPLSPPALGPFLSLCPLFFFPAPSPSSMAPPLLSPPRVLQMSTLPSGRYTFSQYSFCLKTHTHITSPPCQCPCSPRSGASSVTRADIPRNTQPRGRGLTAKKG